MSSVLFSASSLLLGCLLSVQGCIVWRFRHEHAFKRRRVAFSLSQLLCGIVFMTIVVPTVCFWPREVIVWYLVRCVCVLLWFWATLCRQWNLIFDVNCASDYRSFFTLAAVQSGGSSERKSFLVAFSSPKGKEQNTHSKTNQSSSCAPSPPLPSPLLLSHSNANANEYFSLSFGKRLANHWWIQHKQTLGNSQYTAK